MPAPPVTGGTGRGGEGRAAGLLRAPTGLLRERCGRDGRAGEGNSGGGTGAVREAAARGEGAQVCPGRRGPWAGLGTGPEGGQGWGRRGRRPGREARGRSSSSSRCQDGGRSPLTHPLSPSPAASSAGGVRGTCSANLALRAGSPRPGPGAGSPWDSLPGPRPRL